MHLDLGQLLQRLQMPHAQVTPFHLPVTMLWGLLSARSC